MLLVRHRVGDPARRPPRRADRRAAARPATSRSARAARSPAGARHRQSRAKAKAARRARKKARKRCSWQARRTAPCVVQPFTAWTAPACSSAKTRSATACSSAGGSRTRASRWWGRRRRGPRPSGWPPSCSPTRSSPTSGCRRSRSTRSPACATSSPTAAIVSLSGLSVEEAQRLVGDTGAVDLFLSKRQPPGEIVEALRDFVDARMDRPGLTATLDTRERGPERFASWSRAHVSPWLVGAVIAVVAPGGRPPAARPVPQGAPAPEPRGELRHGRARRPAAVRTPTTPGSATPRAARREGARDRRAARRRSRPTGALSDERRTAQRGSIERRDGGRPPGARRQRPQGRSTPTRRCPYVAARGLRGGARPARGGWRRGEHPGGHPGASRARGEPRHRRGERAARRAAHRRRPDRGRPRHRRAEDPSVPPAGRRGQGGLRGLLLGRATARATRRSSTAAGSGVPCTYAGRLRPRHPRRGHRGRAGQLVLRDRARREADRGPGLLALRRPADCGAARTRARCPSTSDQLAGLQRVYALRNTFPIAAANMSLGGGQFTSACDWDALQGRDRQPPLRPDRDRDRLRQRRLHQRRRRARLHLDGGDRRGDQTRATSSRRSRIPPASSTSSRPASGSPRRSPGGGFGASTAPRMADAARGRRAGGHQAGRPGGRPVTTARRRPSSTTGKPVTDTLASPQITRDRIRVLLGVRAAASTPGFGSSLDAFALPGGGDRLERHRPRAPHGRATRTRRAARCRERSRSPASRRARRSSGRGSSGRRSAGPDAGSRSASTTRDRQARRRVGPVQLLEHERRWRGAHLPVRGPAPARSPATELRRRRHRRQRTRRPAGGPTARARRSSSSTGCRARRARGRAYLRFGSTDRAPGEPAVRATPSAG